MQPTVDCFASPGNSKYPLFISRWEHHQAFRVDSLNCSLENMHHIYANPPWKIIPNFLVRLRDNHQLVCLFICPYWAGATWWPLLIKMRLKGTKCLVVPPGEGMFLNCLQQSMPGPKWSLACTVLSGKSWSDRRSKMPILICT